MPEHHRSMDKLVLAQLGIVPGLSAPTQSLHTPVADAKVADADVADADAADADTLAIPVNIPTSHRSPLRLREDRITFDRAAEAWSDAGDCGADADEAAGAWGDGDSSADADEAADAWGDGDQSEPGIVSGTPVLPSTMGVDEAADAWGDNDSGADADNSDAEAESPSSGTADVMLVGDQLNVNADLAGDAWDHPDDNPDDIHADAGTDGDNAEPAASALGADDAADAWVSDDGGILPPGTADDAADAWSSDADVTAVQVISVSPSIVTHVYSASDFQYVNDSWLPLGPSPSEDSSEGSDEDDEAD